MMIRLLSKIFLVALVFSIATTHAQDLDDPLAPAVARNPILVGPVLGYNRATHPVSLPSFANDVNCPTFENGSANGFFVGGSFEYLLGNVVNSTSSIIVRALYNTMPAYLSAAGDNYPSVNQNGVEYRSTTEHTLDVVYSMLTLEAQYKFNILGTNFGVIAGPTIDYTLAATQEQLFKIIDPLDPNNPVAFKPQPDVAYRDNNRTQVIQEGDIPGAGAIRIGLKFGVQYEILTERGFYIVPNINYNLGINKLSADLDWQVNAIQAGVDIRFAL